MDAEKILASGDRSSLVEQNRKTDQSHLSRTLCTFEVGAGCFERRSFPQFCEPTEIGCFNVNGERCIADTNDASQRNARFYCPPAPMGRLPLFLDLSAGYETAIRKDHGSDEKLDILLRYIVANRSRLLRADKRNEGQNCQPHDARDHSSDASLSADFICYRGLLTKLLCTPYERSDGWIIGATLFHGSIYMCAFDTESDVTRRSQQSRQEDLMSYWGFKFEQYVTAGEPGGVPDPNRPVNENEEYCCVCTTKLSGYRLLFGAEVDCVAQEHRNSTSTSRYIELKTNREITTKRQDMNFKRWKLIKWWAQSFLVGIKSIVCGFRDDDGFVRSLEHFRVRDLPKMAAGLWDPCVCFNFLDQFLSYVKQCTSRDDPRSVSKFEWKGSGTSVHYMQLSDPHEYQILPDWYVRSFE